MIDIKKVIDDVKNLAKDAKDGKELAENYKKRAKKNGFGSAGASIAKIDSNLTMVFPVLCSKGISIENASMVSKAMERHYVSMLQRIFAAYQIAGDETRSAADYISNFHQNLDSRLMSMDDVLKITGVTESSEYITSTEEAAIRNDMGRINYVLPSNVNESALSIYTFTENDIGVSGSKNGNSVDINIRVKNDGAAARQNSIAKDIKDNADAKKSAAEYFNKQVLDSDYKKANELMPTTMAISFKVNTGNQIIPVDSALVAVKAKLYPISSEDIVENISKRLEDRNWLTNFIRASTREISFFKDFLFAIDRAKIDALAHSARKKTTDKIWKVLERRATNAKLKKTAQSSSSSDVRPITTLCISQEEVEYLRKHHNIDMESISTVKALFNSLNLLAVVIVDESLEVVKFAFDADDPMWETVSFTHLEREASDNSYKKVVNLMTKIAR